MDNRIILQKAIDQNLEEITRIIEEKEVSLSKAPEGNLRINRRGKIVQYYQVKDNSRRHGKYLKKEDANIAAALAQKAYDMQVVEMLKTFLKEMNGVEAQKFFCQVDQLYSALSIERRKLVIPVRLSTVKYIELWESAEYKGLPFEEEEDIKAIAELCNEVALAYYDVLPKEKRNGRIALKPGTECGKISCVAKTPPSGAEITDQRGCVDVIRGDLQHCRGRGPGQSRGCRGREPRARDAGRGGERGKGFCRCRRRQGRA